MKHILCSMFICFVVVGFACVVTTAEEHLPRGVKWQQIHTDHFTILFAKQHRHVAQRVAHLAEAVHVDLTKFLHYNKKIKKRYVIITDHQDVVDQYDSVTSKKKIMLALRRPYAGNSASLSVRSEDWLAQQFIYQYTSIMRNEMNGFFRKILGIPFPDAGFSGWMDKGMAAYMEHILYEEDGRSSYFDILMRTEVLEDRVTTLAQRAALGFREWPGDIGLFLYGYAFLDYLTETYGIEQLVELNRQQSQTIPMPGNDVFEAVYGKSLKTLENEWLVALQHKYQDQIQTIQSQLLTHSIPLSNSGYFTNSPVFSPDGESVYYIEEIPHETPKLVQLRLHDSMKTTLATGHFSGDFSLSPDGTVLCFCKTEMYKGYYDFSDLYLLDLKTLRVTRLTKGERVFDPVFAPDGETIIYTTSEAGNMQLMKLDITSGKDTALMTTNNYSQIRHPAVSPDGTKLAAQLWTSDGVEDIYVINHDGSNPEPITVDKAIDTSPAWGLNGEYLFFSSDRTGAPNIFAYSLNDQSLYQVTNVLTGVFDPAVSPDGQQLVVEQYSGEGMNIHLVDLDGYEWKMTAAKTQEQSTASGKYAGFAQQDVAGYNPLPSLFPKPGPNIGEDEEGYQLGLRLSGKDILEQHEYSIGVLYGLKSQNISFDAEYINMQFSPTIHLFGYDLPEKNSNLFQSTKGKEKEYFERQQGFGTDILLPLYRTRNTMLSLLTGYEYQKLSALTDLDTLSVPLPDEGILSGASVGILFEHSGTFRYPDEQAGQFLLLKYTRYDDSLGSNFDINEFTGELDIRLKIPVMRTHLLRLRAAGGLSDEDTLEQGVFQLGGFLLEQPSHILEGPQFFLRGYEDNAFAGDRVVVGTVEYRFPLWSPQRTVWRGRIFWDSIATRVFYETGDAWKNDERDLDLKHSVGGEFTLNVGVYYGEFPLSLSVGFAQGLDNDTGESQVYFRFGMDI